MKIINSGNSYHIYEDNVKTSDYFAPNTYKIDFNNQIGFYVSKMPNLKPAEEKIYGNHYDKLNKIKKSYKLLDRSLGVLLSGDKGIGKSLFIQLLAQEYIKEGYPVFVVNNSYPGLIDYIESIQQEIVVIFDEFEKTFKDDGGDADNQEDMLSLLDGTSSQKRLYVATINDVDDISEYLINRPGRFHYHFRFKYPNYDEIISYLKNSTKNVDDLDIQKVAEFSQKVKLNYDMLRAIAFELNSGETFENAINDLNIINNELTYYNIKVELKNGYRFLFKSSMDLINKKEDRTIYLSQYHILMDSYASGVCEFIINDESVIYNNNNIVIKPKEFKLIINDNDCKEDGKIFTLNDLRTITAVPKHFNNRYSYF